LKALDQNVRTLVEIVKVQLLEVNSDFELETREDKK